MKEKGLKTTNILAQNKKKQKPPLKLRPYDAIQICLLLLLLIYYYYMTNYLQDRNFPVIFKSANVRSFDFGS